MDTIEAGSGWWSAIRRGVLGWSACAAAAIMSGCATTTGIPIQITHPAEINMTPYKQVVIGEFSGDMAEDFTASIKESLVESGLFKVVDRAQLSQILGEQRLSASDLADPKKRVKLGKLLSGAVLITGKIDGDYDEKETYQRKTCRESAGKDSGGKTIYRDYDCTDYIKTGRAATSGGVDVVSVQTGEIIKSKRLNETCQSETRATMAHPESPDSRAILGCALRNNVAAFVKAVQPWTETAVANFHKDGSVPAWETGIRHLQVGDFPAAISEFQNAKVSLEGNPKVKPAMVAKGYANLGLAYRFAGKFDDSSAAFQKAFTLSGDQKYIGEKETAERMKAEKRELERQRGGRR